MSEGRITLLAVAALIVGLLVGFGATHWSDQHHSRRHEQTIARQHRPHMDQTRPDAGRRSKVDPMAEFDRMQQEIEGSMQRAMQQFRAIQMPDLTVPGSSEPGYASSLDVRDKGDHFEVHADLPNADKKDVKVTTEGDREVRVNVTQHEEQNKKANGGQTTFREFGSYDQLVTLPEAADMKDMKVDNRNGELVITIPKAKAS